MDREILKRLIELQAVHHLVMAEDLEDLLELLKQSPPEYWKQFGDIKWDG